MVAAMIAPMGSPWDGYGCYYGCSHEIAMGWLWLLLWLVPWDGYGCCYGWYHGIAMVAAMVAPMRWLWLLLWLLLWLVPWDCYGCCYGCSHGIAMVVAMVIAMVAAMGLLWLPPWDCHGITIVAAMDCYHELGI